MIPIRFSLSLSRSLDHATVGVFLVWTALQLVSAKRKGSLVSKHSLRNASRTLSKGASTIGSAEEGDEITRSIGNLELQKVEEKKNPMADSTTLLLKGKGGGKAGGSSDKRVAFGDIFRGGGDTSGGRSSDVGDLGQNPMRK